MDNTIEKRIQSLNDRLSYTRDIFAGKHEDSIRLLDEKLTEFTNRVRNGEVEDPHTEIVSLEDLFVFVEKRLEKLITPMDRVRIVRHPQRICLRDILENVYDNFTEVGGQDEHSLDPSMLIARAVITRRRGKKMHTQSVMVIGQEKGHGAEFRNGGSVKPWGNAKALQYMRVAETEGIPIHCYIFTPGSYPIEDYPGAAQQIARNIYTMAGLRVPVISIISEGGSGGAEAIGLADKRLMLSHGYYSVISPEGGAAIEGRLKAGQRAAPELIEHCAQNLHITAQDNLSFGYIDSVVQEPALGARPHHFDFFRSLRQEVLRATDEVVITNTKPPMIRGLALARLRNPEANLDEMYVRWGMSGAAKNRMRERRQQKFLRLSRAAAIDNRPFLAKNAAALRDWVTKPWMLRAPSPAQAAQHHGRAEQRMGCVQGPPLQPLEAHRQPGGKEGHGQGTDHPFQLGGRQPREQVELPVAALQGRPYHHLPQQRLVRLPRPLGPRSVRRVRGRVQPLRLPLPHGARMVRAERLRQGLGL